MDKNLCLSVSSVNDAFWYIFSARITHFHLRKALAQENTATSGTIEPKVQRNSEKPNPFFGF